MGEGGGGGELMWATRSGPLVIFCLLRACHVLLVHLLLLHVLLVYVLLVHVLLLNSPAGLISLNTMSLIVALLRLVVSQ